MTENERGQELETENLEFWSTHIITKSGNLRMEIIFFLRNFFKIKNKKRGSNLELEIKEEARRTLIVRKYKIKFYT